MKTNPENYYGASTSVCALKNEIIKAIWDVLGNDLAERLRDSEGLSSTHRYYEINRQLGAAIDRFVLVLGVEHRIDITYNKADLTKDVHTNIAHKLADGLLKSNEVAVREFGSPYTPEKTFRVEIPFLRIPRRPTNETI